MELHEVDRSGVSVAASQADRVWRAPRLVPLSGPVDAATGTSTFLVETQQGSTIYAPLPS